MLPRFGVGAAAPAQRDDKVLHPAPPIPCFWLEMPPRAPQPSSPPPFLSSALNQTFFLLFFFLFFFSPQLASQTTWLCPLTPAQMLTKRQGSCNSWSVLRRSPLVITVPQQQLRNFNYKTISVTIPGFDSLPQTPLPLPTTSRSHFGSEVVQVRRSFNN